MMRMMFIFFFSFISIRSSAQSIGDPSPEIYERPPLHDKVKEKIKEIPAKSKFSHEYRSETRSTFLLGYQLISSWIPFKWTVSYNYNLNANWTLEGEFSRGHWGYGLIGLDLASVSENRYSLILRRYWGNSFHGIMGAFRNEFIGKLGNNYVEDLSNKSIDEFEISGNGLILGLGNRWQWGNGVTFGIDWFRINIPLLDNRVENDVIDNLSDNQKTKVIRNLIDKISDIPTFVLFGINLGYSF